MNSRTAAMLGVSCNYLDLMYPLTDITIYNLFGLINVPEAETSTFAKECRFICELYHGNMNGYKPSKTSRITLYLSNENKKHKPAYWDSICQFSNYFNGNKYFSLSKLDRYDFLLNFIHSSILEIANVLNWDKLVLQNAFTKTKESNYTYKKEFPAKLSRNRKKKGQAILEKTEQKAILYIKITGEEINDSTILIDKPNAYPMDASTFIAKNCKWIDHEKFGFSDLKSPKTIFYNSTTKKRVKNIKFPEEDWTF